MTSLVLLFALARPVAFRAEATPEGLRLVDPATGAELSRLPLGRVLAVASDGPAVYAAQASGGVAVVDGRNPKAPRLAGTLLPGVQVDALVVANGRLWTLARRYEGTAFDVSDPLHPGAVALAPPAPAARPAPIPRPPPPPPPRPEAPVRVWHVLAVGEGRVVVDAGRADGLRSGDHVEIVSQALVERPDLVNGGVEREPSGEVTAVVALDHVTAGRAEAQLGRGDLARPGDLVRPATTPFLSERLYTPRRAPFTWRFGFLARPFLGVDDVQQSTSASATPFGLLADLWAAYYFADIPLRLRVEASPFGFSIGGLAHHYPGTFDATAAYSTDYFEAGLGGGALTGMPFAACPSTTFPAAAPGATAPVCQTVGPTIDETLRLGAIDGLMVSWNSSILISGGRFLFGSGRGVLDLPLTRRLTLFGDGGASVNGWALGDFGVRTYVGGSGAPGTVIVSASLGFASVFDGTSGEAITGPSVAFGMEWRL